MSSMSAAALVFGATDGVGEALVDRYLVRGHAVFATGRSSLRTKG